MKQLILQSPAKLNLMLHITGRRADGYHLLQTVFQFIDLSDRLEIATTTDGSISRDPGHSSISETEDITIHAARVLQQRFKVKQGVRIAIDKRIPVGGGLGGGSSNAATTLLALNQLWGLGLELSELATIGLRLGADVPVFVMGEAAWATGIGEQLTPIELIEPWYVVINPGVLVSTAEIFKARELTRDCDAITIRAFQRGSGTNVCEKVACALYPEIRQAIDWLSRYGVAKMSGTGACVFAAFDSLEQAEGVKSRAAEYWESFVVKAMNRNPVVEQCGMLFPARRPG
ncbi:MAG: 4-(cytidine 5'-diphospho)-2-C-methyl-D-erythritol kinase [Gammaproteobacteria bacterium]|nr:4-(cytidine 5'-diphospho)-2-C-methyl-D-erythritol kinase [Gammaproteobacteria bacterium]